MPGAAGQLMVNIRQYWDSRSGRLGLGFGQYTGSPGQFQYCTSPGKGSKCGGIRTFDYPVAADSLRQSEIAFGDEDCGL